MIPILKVLAVAVVASAPQRPATTQPMTNARTLRALDAVHQVESGGRATAPRGDQGRARGPLQIHEAFWRDSRIVGAWSDCERLDYSRCVTLAYWRRYEPQAFADGNAEVLARLHNAGPGWRRNRAATDGYWNRVRAALERRTRS